MGKSFRLRVSEVRAAVRLAGECREFGHDPDGWPAHLATGLTRLTDSVSLITIEYAPGGLRGLTVVRLLEFGGPLAENVGRFREYASQPGLPEHVALSRFLALPGSALVRTGRQLQPDDEWESDAYRHEFLRPLGLDDGLLTRAPAAGGTVVGLSVIRAPGQRRFGPRERRLVSLVHAELVPHLGTRLATSADPIRQLTGRQRQVLDCLLDGDSEKQVAVRLRVAAGTVHEHVKRIYGTFGVASRAELMAHFLRRHHRRGEPT